MFDTVHHINKVILNGIIGVMNTIKLYLVWGRIDDSLLTWRMWNALAEDLSLVLSPHIRGFTIVTPSLEKPLCLLHSHIHVPTHRHTHIHRLKYKNKTKGRKL